MYITDTNFVTLAKSQFRKPIPKVLINGTEVDIVSLDFKDPRDTFVGGFSSKYITLVLGNEELPEGATTIAPFMLFKGSAIEVPIGSFNIEWDDCEFDEVQGLHTLVAYDDSFKFDFQALSINFPATSVQIINQISNAVGVQVDTTSLNELAFGTQIMPGINVSDDESISYRQIINDLAQFNLCSAHIDRDGKLSLRNAFRSQIVDTINGDDYFNLKIDKSLKPINALVYEQENITDPLFQKDEESIGLHGLTELKIIGNIFMDVLTTVERQQYVDLMFAVVNGFTYYPFESDQVMRPDYDSCDVVEIIGIDNTSFKVVLADISWSWVNGGLKGNMVCPFLPETITDYTLAGDKQDLNNMGIKVDRVVKQITLEVSVIKEELDVVGKITEENASNILLNSQGIQMEAIERELLGERLETEMKSALQLTSDSLSLIISKIADDQTLTDSELQEFKTYFRWDANGSIIGKEGHPITLHQTNSGIEIQENGTVIAFWEQGTMSVDNLIAKMSIVIGTHLAEKYESPTVGTTTIWRMI